jgi:hypothetical protein
MMKHEDCSPREMVVHNFIGVSMMFVLLGMPGHRFLTNIG